VLRQVAASRELATSGAEGRGLELAERLISRMGRVFPATGVPSREGAYADLDLRALALGELRSAPSSGSGDVATLSDAAPGDATAQAGATVTGTDAGSWTTLTVGACSYEASAFNPSFCGYLFGLSGLRACRSCRLVLRWKGRLLRGGRSGTRPNCRPVSYAGRGAPPNCRRVSAPAPGTSRNRPAVSLR
jgi:hypothetical protein